MVSWLPFCNSLIVALGLVSIIFWKLGLFFLFVVVSYASIWFLIKESWRADVGRFVSGFWLFVFSEVMIFLSLFMVCMWNKAHPDTHISSLWELPFLGCFLLIGSSITASAFHNNSGSRFEPWLLGVTIILGLSFVLMQAAELYDCDCDLLFSVYNAASFCTVGLHFLHVVIGLIGLVIVFCFRWLSESGISPYFINIVIWYWHFVDYIWIFVYGIVYYV